MRPAEPIDEPIEPIRVAVATRRIRACTPTTHHASDPQLPSASMPCRAAEAPRHATKPDTAPSTCVPTAQPSKGVRTPSPEGRIECSARGSVGGREHRRGSKPRKGASCRHGSSLGSYCRISESHCCGPALDPVEGAFTVCLPFREVCCHPYLPSTIGISLCVCVCERERERPSPSVTTAINNCEEGGTEGEGTRGRGKAR